MANVGGKLAKGQQRRHQKFKGYYEARRNSGIIFRHKADRIQAHLARFPWDQAALARLVEIKKTWLGKFVVDLPALAESPRQARAKRGITLTAWKKAGRPDLADA